MRVFCSYLLTDLGYALLTGAPVTATPQQVADGEHRGVVALALPGGWGYPGDGEEYAHLRCLLDMAATGGLTLTVRGAF